MKRKISSTNTLAIKLPPLGAQEGGKAKLIRWLVRPGERVEQGMEIAEVEADKCAFTVESPASGILGSPDHQEGDTLSEGDVLVILHVSP